MGMGVLWVVGSCPAHRYCGANLGVLHTYAQWACCFVWWWRVFTCVLVHKRVRGSFGCRSLQRALGGGGRRLAMRDRRSPYDILTCVAQRSDIPPSATSYVTRSFRAVCHMGSCCDSCSGSLMTVACTHCYVTLQHCGIGRRCVLPYTSVRGGRRRMARWYASAWWGAGLPVAQRCLIPKRSKYHWLLRTYVLFLSGIHGICSCLCRGGAVRTCTRHILWRLGVFECLEFSTGNAWGSLGRLEWQDFPSVPLQHRSRTHRAMVWSRSWSAVQVAVLQAWLHPHGVEWLHHKWKLTSHLCSFILINLLVEELTAYAAPGRALGRG